MKLAFQMLTRTNRSFWEVTSVMQNSIRKGDYELAGHCAWELFPGYTPYLRKRFLVISAEDCFGVITKEIVALSEIGDDPGTRSDVRGEKEPGRRLLRLQSDVLPGTDRDDKG